MKVLVCGGRSYADRAVMWDFLGILHMGVSFTHVIHGDASGADRMAGAWALEHGVQRIICPADWNKFGPRAGPIRNRRMLELAPDVLVAFPGGRGTDNMVQQAQEANVEVHKVADRSTYRFVDPPHLRPVANPPGGL